MRGKLEKVENVEKAIVKEIGEGRDNGVLKVHKLENILENYKIVIE